MGQFGKAMEEFWLGVMSGFTACMIPGHNMVRLYRDCHTSDAQVLIHRTEFIIWTIFTSEPLTSVSDSNPTITRFAVYPVASAKNGLATPGRVFPHQDFCRHEIFLFSPSLWQKPARAPRDLRNPPK
jgi:hypothetical protein